VQRLQLLWHYAWHYGTSNLLVHGGEGGLGGQHLARGRAEPPFLIMPGSRVRVPPLLYFVPLVKTDARGAAPRAPWTTFYWGTRENPSEHHTLHTVSRYALCSSGVVRTRLTPQQPSVNKPQPYPAAPSTKDWQFLDAIHYQLWIAGKPPIPGYIYDKTKTMRMEPNIIGEQPKFSVKTVDRPEPTECRHI
jgi:hypothetical protein